MDQLTNELKKMVKAGMGAVAVGMEKTQEALETLAKKGEPIYQQAKSAVTDAADKVAQAVSEGIQSMNAKPGVEEIIDTLRGMAQEDWNAVRAALDEFEAAAQAAREAREAAEEILHAEDGAADPAEAPAEETPAEETPAEEPQPEAEAPEEKPEE